MAERFRAVAAMRACIVAWAVVCASPSCTERESRTAPPPEPERVAVARAALDSSATVDVAGDTYIRSGSPNQNQGGDTVVRLQQSGKNRGLLFFDPNAIRSAVSPGSLVSAALELTIDSNGNNWGTTGRAIALHRLKKASAEYNATWNCAIDASTANSSADCSGATAWNMDSTDPNVQPWLSPAIGTSTITNNQTGVVSFNVTADVAAILDNSWAGYGFLLKKVDETAAGTIDFKSKERGVPARLVLEVQPPAAGSGGGGPMDAGVQRATVTAAADNHVRQGDPNQNFGSSNVLRIQASGRNRAIFNFNPAEIHAALGTNGLVRATLELTITQTFNNWGPDRALGAHRMRGAWTELGSTWNCGLDSNTGNSSADCSGVNAWFMWRPDLPDEQEAWVNPPESTALISSGQTGIASFDVTKSIACYLAGHTPLDGVMVKKEIESQSGHVEFASRETATPPVLVLEYNSGSGASYTYTQCTGQVPDGGTADGGVDAGTCNPIATSDVTCDNVDDDCDGQKDEDYAVTGTSCGQGACAATGELQCVNGAVQNSCTAGTGSGTDNDCDGVDQDCDGRTDEAYVSAPTNCGIGACLRNGSSACVAGAVQNGCTPGTPAANDSSCDAIDDDCDGSTDENYASVATSCGVGACVRAGSTSCVTGAVQNNCSPGMPAANDATCDNVDDNCNGVADDGYVSLLTSCGIGACTRAGTTSCVGGAVLDSCVGGTAPVEDATCDGTDDDCSGTADEDYVSLATNCGVGACASTGTTSCVAGAVQDSCMAGTPAATDTTCDGIDDDCSGSADEDYAPQATHCGVGACAATGTTSCSAGGVHDSCASGVPEADDSCDLIDQDCDGQIDEGCESDCSDALDNDDDSHTDCADDDCHDAAECTIGRACTADSECSAMSVTGTPGKCLSLFPGGYCTRDCDPSATANTCPGGSFCSVATSTCVVHCNAQDACASERFECIDLGSLGDDALLCRSTCATGTCRSGTYCNPPDDLCLTCSTADTHCDRIDEDCDGVVDDDVPHQSTTCGRGACLRTGSLTCVNGQMSDDCTPGMPASNDTTCDGVDDDCDGAMDENYASHATTCGVGACLRAGATSCIAGAVHDSCAPGAPATSDATCDAIDDDCNGTADEDYIPLITTCGLGACAQIGASSCIAGQVQDNCVAGAPHADDASCDNQDQDCDGSTDEGYAAATTACGIGACVRSGALACMSGMIVDSCVPGAPVSTDNDCDALDDDCDGTADEEYAASCSGTMRTFCQAGQVTTSNCDDGSVCTGQESCSAGGCHPGTAIQFDDGNKCTEDTCDPITGKITHTNVPAGTSCSDGQACNGQEKCGLPCPAIPSGVLAYWPADGNGKDAVGGHDGALLNGTTFITGVAGQAFHFDGANDGVQATVPMAGRSAATLELWLQTTRLQENTYLISVPRSGSFNGFDLNLRSSGQVRACLFPSGTGACVNGASTYADGHWHHLVATFASDTLRVYFDGALVATGAVSGTLQTLGDQVNLGRFGDAGANFGGNIDEPRIYDRALTAAEIAAIYAGGGPTCSVSQCLPGISPFPDDECNGLDEDCDGKSDEGFPVIATTCGVGLCQAHGVWTCSAGQLNNSCQPAVGLASDACNGQDDDCDGRIDEDFVSTSVSCGDGPCAATAGTACVAGTVVDLCFSAHGQADDDCDGWDDDCDGTVDEAYVTTCHGSLRATCDAGLLVETDCDDGNACNGAETCTAGACVAGPPPAINDGNSCTVDACDPVLGLTHTPQIGLSCADANACNGVERCWPCTESPNLLRNADFETPVTGLNGIEGVMPAEWMILRVTPDTYSNDGSYGAFPAINGNFSGVLAASGIRWLAAWSNMNEPEIFGQELNEPLHPGQAYRLSVKLHQALRSDLNHPGTYEVVLTREYAPQQGVFPRQSLGTFAPTVSFNEGWVDRTLEFVAPQGAESLPIIAFIPTRQAPGQETYPGIDAAVLTTSCAFDDGQPSCRSADVPRVDDLNPCTVDSCAPSSGVIHTAAPQGTACNGSGTCNAAGTCSNRLPTITSDPVRWTWIKSSGTLPYQYTLVATDPDPGATITYGLISGPSGMQVNATTGLVTWSTPQLGAWPIRLKATDNLGGITEQRFILQGALQSGSVPVLAPRITSQPPTTAYENVPYTYQVTAVDDKPQSIRYSLVGFPPVGMSINSTTGLLTFTPSANQRGSHEVQVRVTDDQSLTATQVYTLTIGDIDDAPVFLSAPPTAAIVDQQYNYLPSVRDPDGDVLLFSLGAAPDGMTIDPVTGAVSFTPQLGQTGPQHVAIVVTGGGVMVTQSFTLDVGHASERNPPTLTSSPSNSALEGVTYTYVIGATDPDAGDVLRYGATTLPEGATFNPNTREVRWVPLASQVGPQAFELTVTDGLYTIHQVWTVLVTDHNETPQLLTAPETTARAGELYRYRCLAVDPDGDTLVYALITSPAGMSINAASGEVQWTPSLAQQGTHSVVISVTDGNGAQAVQSFGITVGDAAPANLAPVFVSLPVQEATTGAVYVYDANATDPDVNGPVDYALVEGPPDMTIDATSGVVQWIADAPGSYQVVLRASDGQGGEAEQAFGINVGADRQGPSVEIQASQTHVAPGETTMLTVVAQDGVAVDRIDLTIDGVAWPLDAAHQVLYSSQRSGPHRVVAVATDSSNNTGGAELVLAVTEPGDLIPPSVSFDANVEGSVLTSVHEIHGSVNDEHLLYFTLSLKREGTTEWTVVDTGMQNVTSASVGTIDTTLLEDGMYQLRLYAEDVNGLNAEVIRPVRVDGGAKVGVVQLSFVDMAVPMQGMPISVVRTYDSRRMQSGDFGHGWSLELRHGSVQHNRPVGSYFALYSGDTGGATFEFPCQRVNEQRPHLTEIRLGEREWYLFRPRLANTEAVAGGCTADVYYELVDGSTAGAELVVNGNTMVRADRSLRVADETIPDTFPMSLLDAYTLEPFNPESFQLLLADGRLYDLTVQQGIVRMADANDNWLFIDQDRIAHSDGRQIDIERDAAGRVNLIRGPNGRTVGYGYDAQGDLAFVRDPLNRITAFSYYREPAHHLRSILRPDGVEVAALAYTPDNRLSESCDAERRCTQFEYDLTAQTQVVHAPGNGATTYEYDARGNVTRQTDALGHAVTFAYDDHDHLTRAEGPDGSEANYRYDASGNLTQRVLPHEADEDAADFIYNYTYTAHNDRDTVTLPSGGVIDYDYDGNGNLTAVKDGAGTAIEQRTYDSNGNLASRTDRFGTTGYTNYNPTGQPRTVTDPFGATIALAYDAQGDLTSRTERGITMTMRYDAASRPTHTDYGNGATVDYEYGDAGDARWTAIEGPTFGRVERRFSAAGGLTSWREPNGDTFTRFYDAGGRVSEEIDALGNSTLYAYDAAGRLQGVTDATLNATTTFERDSAGRVTKTTDALGHDTHTSYKLGGRLETTTNARGKTTYFDRNPLSASITDALNRTTVTSLSTYGLPLGTQYPGGSDTSSSYLGTTRLDGSQQFPTSFEDELQRSRNYGYDTKSGLTSATDLAGQSWQYQYAPAAGSGVSYDVMSGTVGTVQQDGGASAYQSGSGGTEYRDVATTGGGDGGNFTHMLSQVTSPMGEVTKFERGQNGRISKVTYPDGGTRTIAYDAANRAKTITLPQGTVVTLGHDGLGRETSRTTSTGEFRYLTYGVGDRIETMTDNTGTTDYEYDSAGRFSGIVYPTGGSVRYTRDKLDRTTDVTVKPSASGAAINTHYTYDENGNLAEILDPTNHTTAFTYDDVDRLTTRLLPNGVTTSYSYDDRDRVLSVVHKNASNVVLASVTYVRSPSGEPSKITREDGSYTDIEYDSALRVKKESEHDGNGVLIAETQYEYDSDGNRTKKTSLTGEDTYSYQPGFKLTSVTHSAGGGDDTFGYDSGGRVTSITRDGTTKTLEYDSFDHITKVSEGGIERVRYTFDGAGNRVTADDGLGVKRFLTAPNMGAGYDSPQAVTDAAGSVLATFVYANGDAPFMKITPNSVEYLLTDSVNSVIGKADSGGTATATIKYTAFGDVTSAIGASSGIDPSVGFENRLHGMLSDASTGIYFVRARSYDARTGRFLSRDPESGTLGRPETMNPYSFANGNPCLYVDPTGQFGLLEITASLAVVGVLTSTAAASLAGYLHSTEAYKNGTQAAGYLQGVADTGAAIGDTLSLHISSALRSYGEQQGWWGNDIDTSSSEYNAGVYAGYALMFVEGATAIAQKAWGSFIGVAEYSAIGSTRLAVSYEVIAAENGYNFYHIPQSLWNALSADARWALNRVWLNGQIAARRAIFLTHGLEPAILNGSAEGGALGMSTLSMEIQYLQLNGYRLVGDWLLPAL